MDICLRTSDFELFLADIRELPSVEELERVADPQRLKRSRAMRTEGARLLCLGAGWLLHRAFGAREYRTGPWGRPELVGEGPFFSLSHSGTKVMLLVSDTPCGCDIEERIPSRPLERIAERFFHPAEFADFRRLGATTNLFYRLWTLAESYMKGVGKGFGLSPTSFHHEAAPPHRLLESPEPGFEAWRFHVSEDVPGYTYAVARTQATVVRARGIRDKHPDVAFTRDTSAKDEEEDAFSREGIPAPL